MNNEKNNNGVESFGKAIGTILGITILTVWVTIVASFTHNWYVGG